MQHCAYLDVLEKMLPVGLIFKEEHLLPFAVKPLIKLCLLEPGDLVECIGEPNEMFDSHFNRFLFIDILCRQFEPPPLP